MVPQKCIHSWHGFCMHFHDSNRKCIRKLLMKMQRFIQTFLGRENTTQHAAMQKINDYCIRRGQEHAILLLPLQQSLSYLTLDINTSFSLLKRSMQKGNRGSSCYDQIHPQPPQHTSLFVNYIYYFHTRTHCNKNPVKNLRFIFFSVILSHFLLSHEVLTKRGCIPWCVVSGID